MKISPALILAVALLAVATGRAEPPPGYVLKWNDEFDGTKLDETKWSHWHTGKRRDATNTPDAVEVRDGFLTITTWSAGGRHYTGGVTTEGLFASAFGYWEARIKWSDASGTWSAFWVQSPGMLKTTGDVAKDGVELDVVEHRAMNNENEDIADIASQTLHFNGYGKEHRSKGHGAKLSQSADGFHIYACEWSKEGYRWFIDGKQVWTVKEPVSECPQFIILSTEVEGTAWGGKIPKEGYGDRTSGKVRMVVDYVRYYTKP
jgi:beta-glucanase (GH16 family)